MNGVNFDGMTPLGNDPRVYMIPLALSYFFSQGILSQMGLIFYGI